MMEKYSCYEFEIRKHYANKDKWDYLIWGDDYQVGYTAIRESEEWFETEQEARFAAIGHIDLLESGEG